MRRILHCASLAVLSAALCSCAARLPVRTSSEIVIAGPKVPVPQYSETYENEKVLDIDVVEEERKAHEQWAQEDAQAQLASEREISAPRVSDAPAPSASRIVFVPATRPVLQPVRASHEARQRPAAKAATAVAARAEQKAQAKLQDVQQYLGELNREIAALRKENLELRKAIGDLPADRAQRLFWNARLRAALRATPPRVEYRGFWFYALLALATLLLGGTIFLVSWLVRVKRRQEDFERFREHYGVKVYVKSPLRWLDPSAADPYLWYPDAGVDGSGRKMVLIPETNARIWAEEVPKYLAENEVARFARGVGLEREPSKGVPAYQPATTAQPPTRAAPAEDLPS
jgi:hypothetical protein